MEWTADVSVGVWIRDRLEREPWWETMHTFVPRGFDSYAAIPHAEVVSESDGRIFAEFEQGRVDAARLAAASVHLAAHTATDDEVSVAVWEGWGGLVGGFSEAPSRVALGGADDQADDPALAAHHREMLERSIRDPFNNVFRRPVWQQGILSDEISRGERLRLPHRDHVLFRAQMSEFADVGWASRVPWAEDDPEWTASPSLIWPADRAWVLATEIDAGVTLVGGSPQLVRDLCLDAAVGAREQREGTPLADLEGFGWPE